MNFGEGCLRNRPVRCVVDERHIYEQILIGLFPHVDQSRHFLLPTQIPSGLFFLDTSIYAEA